MMKDDKDFLEIWKVICKKSTLTKMKKKTKTKSKASFGKWLDDIDDDEEFVQENDDNDVDDDDDDGVENINIVEGKKRTIKKVKKPSAPTTTRDEGTLKILRQMGYKIKKQA